MNIFSELTAICIGSFIGNSASSYFSSKNKKISNKPFLLRLDLSEPDKDTFYSIAKKFGIIPEDLMKLNNAKDASKLRDGSKIKVPAKE